MIDALVLAVIDRLREVGLRAEDGTLGEDVELPAVAVHGFPGAPFRTSMGRSSDGGRSDVVLVLVGTSSRSVRWLSDRVEGALQDVVLDVAGRRCAPARRIASRPPDLEHQLNPPRWSGSDTYRISTYMAPEGDAP